MPPSRPIGKLPENLIRPPFENPLMPSTLRFGSDPNLSQSPQPLLDPLAAHRKMMSIRPPGFPPTSGPSLYEMAALTNELDTQTITTKVKEILLAHNVGQKVIFKCHVGAPWFWSCFKITLLRTFLELIKYKSIKIQNNLRSKKIWKVQIEFPNKYSCLQ